MGLGFMSISQFGASQPFQTLQNEGALSSSVFGFNLGTSGPELTVGGVDLRYNIDADFTWLSINPGQVCQISNCV